MGSTVDYENVTRVVKSKNSARKRGQNSRSCLKSGVFGGEFSSYTGLNGFSNVSTIRKLTNNSSVRFTDDISRNNL